MQRGRKEQQVTETLSVSWENSTEAMGNSACLPSVQTFCEQRLFWRTAQGGRGRAEGVPGGIHLESCSKGQTSADELLLTPWMWGTNYELDSIWLVGVCTPWRLPTGLSDGVVALSAEALHCLSPVQRIFFSACPYLSPPLAHSRHFVGGVWAKEEVRRGIGNQAAPASSAGSSLI